MTECSSITTSNVDGTVGSVGKPMPWFDVGWSTPRAQPVAAGERGEIVVRDVAAGRDHARLSVKDPEATARAFRGGAFHTGDLGSFDAAGNMYFHGRMTDNVRVRGENVSAAEVEQVARKHPAVEDCAMIGVAAEVGEAGDQAVRQAEGGREPVARELSDLARPAPRAVTRARATSPWWMSSSARRASAS